MKTDLENKVLALRGKHYSPSEIVKLTGAESTQQVQDILERDKAEINEIESELGITDNKKNKTKAENIKKVKINNYDVYIGKNAAKEIDFVAVRRDERIYVQVCRNLPEDSDREVTNLLEIKDHYPKYVVTLDELAAGNINGVKIVHLADFLLSEDY